MRPSRRLARRATSSRCAGGERVEVGERLGDGTRARPLRRRPARGHGRRRRDAAAAVHPRPSRRQPDRYQTVYARPPGSAAAPTAGLHFTPELLDILDGRWRGARRRDAARRARHVPSAGGRLHRRAPHPPRVVRGPVRHPSGASTRRIGSWPSGQRPSACSRPRPVPRTTSGWTDLYITPPYRFRAADALVTNFHLPRSSLLLLVTAFVQAGMGAGATPLEARDRLLGAYRGALDEGYRFFSFGDAMLIV